MSSSEETSSLNKAVETFQETLATSDLHPVQQDLFQSIVQTYDSEIQALKARYKTMNAEHLLARMEDHQRVSSVLEKIGPEINALTDIIHKLGKDKRSSGEEALTKLSEQVAALTAEANRKNLERISGKASKNHFTRLSALWRHYEPLGLIDRNPFVGGWKFDTTAKTQRIRWSNDDLMTLIENPWPFQTISQATFGLIVGIASYTGMREEEICRLRPQDIVQIQDVWCIAVQVHRAHKDAPWEAWDPKTEAGARIVPLCQPLLDTGLVEMAKRAKNQRRRYLFKELNFTGMDMKRSGIFQRNFSSFKSRLGIGREKVFHSFRHNVSTKIRNIHEHGDGGLRESWIDNFLGHEGLNKSVGNIVYFDDVDITNLKRVADSMSYPEFWDLKRLMGKQ
nr:tyrosine-type recombinase/integrase [Gluconobacter sp. DsW_056]